MVPSLVLLYLKEDYDKEILFALIFFIIYFEGLLALFQRIERDDLLHCIHICHRALAVSHLLFACDSFFSFLE